MQCIRTPCHTFPTLLSSFSLPSRHGEVPIWRSQVYPHQRQMPPRNVSANSGFSSSLGCCWQYVGSGLACICPTTEWSLCCCSAPFNLLIPVPAPRCTANAQSWVFGGCSPLCGCAAQMQYWWKGSFSLTVFSYPSWELCFSQSSVWGMKSMNSVNLKGCAMVGSICHPLKVFLFIALP